MSMVDAVSGFVLFCLGAWLLRVGYQEVCFAASVRRQGDVQVPDATGRSQHRVVQDIRDDPRYFGSTF